MSTGYEIYLAHIPPQFVDEEVRLMLATVVETGGKVKEDEFGVYFQVIGPAQYETYYLEQDDCYFFEWSDEDRLEWFRKVITALIKQQKVSLILQSYFDTVCGNEYMQEYIDENEEGYEGCDEYGYPHTSFDSDEGSRRVDSILRRCPSLVLMEVLANRMK